MKELSIKRKKMMGEEGIEKGRNDGRDEGIEH